MLIVLVGARGAGKSTLQDALRAGETVVLKPSTTRAPRFLNDVEYDFVTHWDDPLYAWRISVGSDTYGMRRSELDRAKSDTCVTVFEPLSLGVFDALRHTLGLVTMTVGLNTIADLTEQRQRVGDDPKRVLDAASFARASKVVSECDIVLQGNAHTVLSAVNTMIRLLRSRGGIVTKEFLTPLIAAGAMLKEAELSNIQSASYDLRVGREILCQGKVLQLSDSDPHFKIPPYSYAIVSALERASLPPFVAGRFDLKVSLFFEGVILSNGPQIDPGYKGALFCMLYNGSGRPKLLTLGSHFATIDFTTTTSVTDGYRAQYQLREKLSQFASSEAVTGQGDGITEFIDQKVKRVRRSLRKFKVTFWILLPVAAAIFLLIPALVVPVLWTELTILHNDKIAIDDAKAQIAEELKAAKENRQIADKQVVDARSVLDAAQRQAAELIAAASQGIAAAGQQVQPRRLPLAVAPVRSVPRRRR